MDENLQNEIQELKKQVESLAMMVGEMHGVEIAPLRMDDGQIRYEPKEVVDISKILRNSTDKQADQKGGVARIIHAGRVLHDGKMWSQWVNTGDFDLIQSVPMRRIADLASPFTSEQRISMMKSLLEERGGKTSSQLAEVVELEAGPLYHHLRELEMAKYIRKEERGRYTLASKGIIALMTISHMAAMLDHFDRDVPSEASSDQT